MNRAGNGIVRDQGKGSPGWRWQAAGVDRKHSSIPVRS